jgi:hypothetical protein
VVGLKVGLGKFMGAAGLLEVQPTKHTHKNKTIFIAKEAR